MSLSEIEAEQEAMKAEVKYELGELEVAVLKYSYMSEYGVSQEMLMRNIPDKNLAEIVDAINRLSEDDLVEIMDMGDGNYACKGVPYDEVEKLNNISPEGKIVYKAIKEAGTEGIWSKNISTKTNLHLNVVQKILKGLEAESLVKSTKSVKNPSKKLYLLWDNDPSADITGGTWYNEEGFNQKLVENIYENSYRYIVSKSFPNDTVADGKGASFSSGYAFYPSTNNVLEFIITHGITNVALTKKDIAEILNLLVYDGKVIRLMGSNFSGAEPRHKKQKKTQDDDDENDNWHYKAIYSEVVKDKRFNTSPLENIPCTKCPVANECHPTGKINPSSCKYFQKWFEF